MGQKTPRRGGGSKTLPRPFPATRQAPGPTLPQGKVPGPRAPARGAGGRVSGKRCGPGTDAAHAKGPKAGMDPREAGAGWPGGASEPAEGRQLPWWPNTAALNGEEKPPWRDQEPGKSGLPGLLPSSLFLPWGGWALGGRQRRRVETGCRSPGPISLFPSNPNFQAWPSSETGPCGHAQPPPQSWARTKALGEHRTAGQGCPALLLGPFPGLTRAELSVAVGPFCR